jgi:hypothetical protein
MELQKFLSLKGQYCKLTLATQKKPAAAHKERKLEKITEGVFRVGINYSNMKTVIEKRGGSTEPEPLPWGEWYIFPYVIIHKGEYYYRVYPMWEKITVRYFVDGRCVDRETFKSYLTPSEANKLGEAPECLTVKAQTIGFDSIVPDYKEVA